MMKKIYIAPENIIVNIIAQPILFGGSNGDKTLNGGSSLGDLGVSDEVLSRRADSLWEDEE